MKKVSFDFDGTLDKKSVQEYVRELISRGIQVWICTSRLNDVSAPNKEWNYDLYIVASQVGISKSRIKFMNHETRSDFFKNSDFIWHLDDDWIELNFINRETKTKGISVFGNSTWKQKCDKLL